MGLWGPPETAYHLLTQCPATYPWVRAAVGPPPPEGEVDRILGGRLQPAAMIRLVGEIARAAGHESLSVISAIGTRDYYRRRGFLDGRLYQHRPLRRADGVDRNCS